MHVALRKVPSDYTLPTHGMLPCSPSHSSQALQTADAWPELHVDVPPSVVNSLLIKRL